MYATYVNKGAVQAEFPQLVNEKRIPHKIFVTFVDRKAFDGDPYKNPFDLRRHFKVGVEAADGDALEEDLSTLDEEEGEDIGSETTSEDDEEGDDDDFDPDNDSQLDPEILKIAKMSKAEMARQNKGSLASMLSKTIAVTKQFMSGKRSSRCSSEGSVRSSRSFEVLSMQSQPSTSNLTSTPAPLKPKTRKGKAPAKTPTTASPPASKPRAKNNKCGKNTRKKASAGKDAYGGNYLTDNGEPDIMDAKKNYVFVDQLVVKLNGETLSTFEANYTKSECYGEWVRFKEANGTWRTSANDGITFKMFNSNFFLGAFSLATSLPTDSKDTNLMIPSVTACTEASIRAHFSDELPSQQVMVIYAIYTAAFQINNQGRISASYNSVN